MQLLDIYIIEMQYYLCYNYLTNEK